MGMLRMADSTVSESITIDQLEAEIQAAKAAGMITGQSKVVMSQMCGHNIFSVKAVIAGDDQDQHVLALSMDSEDELLAASSSYYKYEG